jgi:hypothetical protein
VDEVQGTVHEIWRWTGEAFHPTKEWQTVKVWSGKEYVSTRLNGQGDIPSASRDCSIEAAHRSIATVDDAAPVTPGEAVDTEKRTWPLSHLRCQRFTEGGVAILFRLADWPSVGDEPWFYVQKAAGKRWQVLGGDAEFECLEKIGPYGFTTSHLMISAEHPAGCPSQGPCIRHDKWQWSGSEFAVSRSWFTAKRSESNVACEQLLDE